MTLDESAARPAMAPRERVWAPPAPSFLRLRRDELTGLSPARRFRMLRMTAVVVVVAIVRSGAGVAAPARLRGERLERAGTGDISPHVKDRSSSVAAARARVVRQLDLPFLGSPARAQPGSSVRSIEEAWIRAEASTAGRLAAISAAAGAAG
jgi:hypothetical protein